jgi:hypothetical protein
MAEPWTSADDALVETISILADAAGGRLGGRPGVQSLDPLIAPADEIVLVDGVYSLSGALVPCDGLFEDAEDAGDVWSGPRRRIPEGRVHVSSHGFYLRTRSQLTAFPWSQVRSVTLGERSTIQVAASAMAGYPVTFTLRSPWAELMFGLWCLGWRPQYAWFRLGNWLPPGWRWHAEAHGRWPGAHYAEVDAALTAEG